MQNINLHQGKLHRSPIQLIGNPYWGDSPSPIKSNRDKPVLGKTSIAVFHTSFPTFPFHPSGHMWNPAPVHKKFQRKHHFHSTISTWFGFFATGTHSTPNSKISTPKFRTWKKSTPEGVQHMYVSTSPNCALPELSVRAQYELCNATIDRQYTNLQYITIESAREPVQGNGRKWYSCKCTTQSKSTR